MGELDSQLIQQVSNGSLQPLLHLFQAQLTGHGGWLAPARALVSAFLFAQVLAWTYEYTYEGLGYSRGFTHTIVLTTISAAILVLSMQQSLLAGLGLFGVLSMIRFRSDLKTPRDLVFVMGSATLGVAAGVEATAVGVLGTVTFSLVCLYLYLGPFGSRARFDGVLRFRVPLEVPVHPELGRLLGRYCRRQVLLSVRELDSGDAKEHSYQIKFFRERDQEALLVALREAFEAHDTRLLLQEASSEF